MAVYNQLFEEMDNMLTKGWTLAIIVILGLCGLTGIVLMDYNIPKIAIPLIVIAVTGLALFSIGLCLAMFAPTVCDSCDNNMKEICENCDIKDVSS